MTTSVAYTVSASSNDAPEMIVWQFYGQGGMNDTAILALVQMLRDFPWPSAVGPVTVTASKSVSDVTGSYCAVSTNPPAFN